MSFLRRLFGGKPAAVDHPAFGRLEFVDPCSWERAGLSFWGVNGVSLAVVDLDRAGPTEAQAAAFTRLSASGDLLRPRCLTALEAKRREAGAPAGEFALVSVLIPGLDAAPILGFKAAGDERFLYRVDVEDDGRKLTASIDDLSAL